MFSDYGPRLWLAVCRGGWGWEEDWSSFNFHFHFLFNIFTNYPIFMYFTHLLIITVSLMTLQKIIFRAATPPPLLSAHERSWGWLRCCAASWVSVGYTTLKGATHVHSTLNWAAYWWCFCRLRIWGLNYSPITSQFPFPHLFTSHPHHINLIMIINYVPYTWNHGSQHGTSN